MSWAGFPGPGDPWWPASTGGGWRLAPRGWGEELNTCHPPGIPGTCQLWGIHTYLSPAPGDPYVPVSSSRGSIRIWLQLQGIHTCLALLCPPPMWGVLERCRGGGGPQYLPDSKQGGRGPEGCPTAPRAAPLPADRFSAPPGPPPLPTLPPQSKTISVDSGASAERGDAGAAIYFIYFIYFICPLLSALHPRKVTVRLRGELRGGWAPSPSAASSPSRFLQLPATFCRQQAKRQIFGGGGSRDFPPPVPAAEPPLGCPQPAGTAASGGGGSGAGAWHLPAGRGGTAAGCSLFPAMLSSPLPPPQPTPRIPGMPPGISLSPWDAAQPAFLPARSQLPPTFPPPGKRRRTLRCARSVTGRGGPHGARGGGALPPGRCWSRAAAPATPPSRGFPGTSRASTHVPAFPHSPPLPRRLPFAGGHHPGGLGAGKGDLDGAVPWVLPTARGRSGRRPPHAWHAARGWRAPPLPGPPLWGSHRLARVGARGCERRGSGTPCHHRASGMSELPQGSLGSGGQGGLLAPGLRGGWPSLFWSCVQVSGGSLKGTIASGAGKPGLGLPTMLEESPPALLASPT